MSRSGRSPSAALRAVLCCFLVAGACGSYIDAATVVLTQDAINHGLVRFPEIQQSIYDALMTVKIPSVSEIPACGNKFSISFSGRRIVNIKSLTATIISTGIRVVVKFDYTIHTSAWMKGCTRRTIKILGKRVASWCICTSNLCSPDTVFVSPGSTATVDLVWVPPIQPAVINQNAVPVSGSLSVVNVDVVMNPSIASGCNFRRGWLPGIYDTFLSGGTGSVRRQVQQKVVESASRRVVELNQQLILPQSYSPFKNVYIDYYVTSATFVPGESIIGIFKAVVKANVNNVNITYSSNNPLLDTILPPFSWADLRVQPGRFLRNGNPMLFSLRLTSTFMTAFLWCMKQLGDLTTSSTTPVMDTNIGTDGFFALPETQVLGLNKLGIAIASGSLQVQCFDNTTRARSTMLALSFLRLAATGDIVWQDTLPQGLSLHVAGFDTNAVQPSLTQPKLPLPTELLDEILKAALSRLTELLNKYFAAQGAIQLPPTAYHFLPLPILSLVQQNWTAAGTTDISGLKHGIIDLTTVCVCGAPFPTGCSFSCIPTTTTTTPSTTTTTAAEIDLTVTVFQDDMGPIVTTQSTPTIIVQYFRNSGTCDMSASGAEMVVRALPSTAGRCVLMATAEGSAYYQAGPSATDAVAFSCTDSSCTNCLIQAQPGAGQQMCYSQSSPLGNTSFMLVPAMPSGSPACTGGAASPSFNSIVITTTLLDGSSTPVAYAPQLVTVYTDGQCQVSSNGLSSTAKFSSFGTLQLYNLCDPGCAILTKCNASYSWTSTEYGTCRQQADDTGPGSTKICYLNPSSAAALKVCQVSAAAQSVSSSSGWIVAVAVVMSLVAVAILSIFIYVKRDFARNAAGTVGQGVAAGASAIAQRTPLLLAALKRIVRAVVYQINWFWQQLTLTPAMPGAGDRYLRFWLVLANVSLFSGIALYASSHNANVAAFGGDALDRLGVPHTGIDMSALSAFAATWIYSNNVMFIVLMVLLLALFLVYSFFKRLEDLPDWENLTLHGVDTRLLSFSRAALVLAFLELCVLLENAVLPTLFRGIRPMVVINRNWTVSSNEYVRSSAETILGYAVTGLTMNRLSIGILQASSAIPLPVILIAAWHTLRAERLFPQSQSSYLLFRQLAQKLNLVLCLAQLCIPLSLLLPVVSIYQARGADQGWIAMWLILWVASLLFSLLISHLMARQLRSESPVSRSWKGFTAFCAGSLVLMHLVIIPVGGLLDTGSGAATVFCSLAFSATAMHLFVWCQVHSMRLTDGLQGKAAVRIYLSHAHDTVWERGLIPCSPAQPNPPPQGRLAELVEELEHKFRNPNNQCLHIVYRFFIWLEESRERAAGPEQIAAHGHRGDHRRLILTLGAIFFFTAACHDMEDAFQSDIFEAVQSALISFGVKGKWPRGDDVIFNPAIKDYERVKRIAAVFTLLASFAVIGAVLIDIPGKRWSLSLSRWLLLIATILLMIALLVPILPPYLADSHLLSVIPFCAHDFTNAVTQVINYVVSTASTSFVMLSLAPILITIPAAIARGVNTIYGEMDERAQLYREQEPDLPVFLEFFHERRILEYIVASTYFIGPLLTALPFSVLYQLLGDTTIPVCAVLLWLLPPSLWFLVSVLYGTRARAQSIPVIGAPRLLVYTLSSLIILLTLILVVAGNNGASSYAIDVLSDPYTYVAVLAEVAIAMVVVSDLIIVLVFELPRPPSAPAPPRQENAPRPPQRGGVAPYPRSLYLPDLPIPNPYIHEDIL
eukprot:m.257687 g.257687  ORF g.257687 m.257687 type:complete len:1735 (+) comp21012_c0_seq1:131-5335(+)